MIYKLLLTLVICFLWGGGITIVWNKLFHEKVPRIVFYFIPAIVTLLAGDIFGVYQENKIIGNIPVGFVILGFILGWYVGSKVFPKVNKKYLPIIEIIIEVVTFTLVVILIADFFL